MSEEAEFRGSGTFRVDRAKALEKLSAFQLERGEQFLLPLARSAAAAGASRLAVSGVSALDAAFDGRPFERTELADPYGALFAEDAEPRLRHFAAFLLGALRTGPREVSVVSGPAGRRCRLRAAALGAESVEDDDSRGEGTVVRVRWNPVRGLRRAPLAKAAAREAWVMTPPGFTVDQETPWENPAASRLVSRLRRDGLALRLEPPEDPAETRITFCALGVAVETIKTLLPDAQVRAWVDDAAFALTASQSAVVEDSRRQRALDAVGAAAAPFLAETAERFASALPEGRSAASGPAWADAARTWFAATLRRRAGAGRREPDPLWQAPFLSDAAGRALSLAGLGASPGPDGRTLYSTVRAGSARLPKPVAYCPRAEDRALLESVFSGGLLDATQLIESLDLLK